MIWLGFLLVGPTLLILPHRTWIQRTYLPEIGSEVRITFDPGSSEVPSLA